MSLFGGMLGYAHFEGMSWLDAFLNAAIILSGMGPVEPLKTNAGKLFAGCYAIYSGLIVILITGIVLARLRTASCTASTSMREDGSREGSHPSSRRPTLQRRSSGICLELALAADTGESRLRLGFRVMLEACLRHDGWSVGSCARRISPRQRCASRSSA